MQKVWQWLRDKKTNTIRKWRSTIVGQRSASTTRVDNPFEDGRFYVPSMGESTHLLAAHAYDSNRLRLGTSDSVLQRGASRSKRAIQQLQRKLTPTRRMRNESNGVAKKAGSSLLKPSKSTDDYRRESNNELRQLLLEEDDSYQSRSSYDYAGAAGGTRTPDLSNSNDFLDNYEPSDYSPGIGRSNMSLSETNRRATVTSSILSQKPRKGGTSSRWSLSTSSKPPASPISAPNSARTQRRRFIRFAIPQVSLSTEDPNASTTLLFADSQEDIRGMSGEATTLSSPAEGRRSGGAYSPLPARRGNSDTDNRRMSLAAQQRRQSNTQLVQSVSGRRASTTLVPLSMAQIHLIRTLWRQVYMSKGPTVIGETVIHRLFFKHPKLKEQFRRTVPPKNFPNHDSFSKFHAKAMGELIDQIVENLDNLDAMAEQLERIGRAHAQVLNGQLSSKLWNLVAETFIDCTLEWGDRRCRSETVRKAWALIIAFMVEKIKHGHLDQRKQMLAVKSTISGLERVALGSRS